MNISNITVEEWVSNEEHHLEQLQKDSTLSEVPLINVNEVQNFQDGALVRFRGMVQDMYGSELYLKSYHFEHVTTGAVIVKNGKYRDAISSDGLKEYQEVIGINSSDRHCYVVVSVPGLNSWVQQHDKEHFTVKNSIQGFKKEGGGSVSQSSKRSIEEAMDTDEESARKKPTLPTDTSQQQQQHKKLLVSREHLLNHPLGDTEAKVCHVKVYKDNDSIKINEVFEFVGFLSMDLLEQSEEEALVNEMELQTHFPPSSLVPRLHVVYFKPLLHMNPFIGVDVVSNLSNNLSVLRKDLFILLNQLLLGDHLSAEYLICNLISEIYLRRECMPLGKFCLNLSKTPKLDNVDYVQEFYDLIKQLLPKSHYIALTLENMNSLAFTPKKDYECNRLTSGVLQLSKNTHLILDETKLQDGKLDPAGVKNLRALSKAIIDQKVPYDFQYYSLDYECDLPVIVFSEVPSILPSDIHIPIKADADCLHSFKEILQAARHFLQPEMLLNIRRYLTQARMVEYKLTEEVQHFVQEEFVQMRQDYNVTPDDLHNLLVLGRLLSISEGRSTLDSDIWRKACDLERQRKARILT